MSLRFKLAAITSATLLAAGLGVALAAPASAVNDQPLCIITNQECAIDSAANLGAVVDMSQGAGGVWDVPSGHGQISLSGGGVNGQPLCMKADYGHTSHGNGNPIVLASCSGADAEEWYAEPYNHDGYHFTYYFNGANINDCLNDHYSLGKANVAPCNAANANPNYNELWLPYHP